MKSPDQGCVGFFVETPIASVYSIFPLLPKAKFKETIPKGKIRKSKRKEKMLPQRTLGASFEAQLL